MKKTNKIKLIFKMILIFYLINLIQIFISSKPVKISLPFPIYTDHGNFALSYVPSGWMGDYPALLFNDQCKINPKKGTTCLKWSYNSKILNFHQWAGVYWQFPANNWGQINGGYDLKGARSISFWARGKTGNEIIQFKVGGIHGTYPDSVNLDSHQIKLNKNWTQYTLDIAEKDLSQVNGVFCWTASINDQIFDEITFYLDEIWVS